jgi:hypothetical protein
MDTESTDSKGPAVLDYAAPPVDEQKQEQAEQHSAWYDGIDPFCAVDLSPLVDGVSSAASAGVEAIGHVVGAIVDGIG